MNDTTNTISTELRWNAHRAMHDAPDGSVNDDYHKAIVWRYNHHRTSELERRLVVLFGVIDEWRAEVSSNGAPPLYIQDEVDELSAILNLRPDRSHPDLDLHSYFNTLWSSSRLVRWLYEETP